MLEYDYRNLYDTHTDNFWFESGIELEGIILQNRSDFKPKVTHFSAPKSPKTEGKIG